MTAEMLKAGGQDVVHFLTRMFNALFEKSIYPQDWAKAIIIPIHLKEAKNGWIIGGGGDLYSELSANVTRLC